MLMLGSIALVLGFAISSSAQSLTDAQIASAIKAGETKKFNHLVSECYATAGFGASMAASISGGIAPTGGFTITLSTNAGRIALMAARGKRLYKPLTLDQIGDDLRAPMVILSVEPSDPNPTGNHIRIAAPIEHVVLKSKAASAETAQPTKVDKEPVEWGNLVGGKVESNRAVAFFEFGAVKELPAGDFDVVVITPAGERRCKVGTKDRQRLFSAQP